jgi:hypothetical protein
MGFQTIKLEICRKPSAKFPQLREQFARTWSPLDVKGSRTRDLDFNLIPFLKRQRFDDCRWQANC